MIAASRDQEPAIGAECQAADEASVTAEVADQLAGVAVPDFHDTVFTRRGEPSAIADGAERQGVDLSFVSLEHVEFLAALHVPDLDRVPLTSRRQPPAVRAEGHVQTRSGDPRAKGEASFFLLLQGLPVQPLRVPEFYDAVRADRRQVLAIAAKDQSADVPFVSIERADRLAGSSIPHLHGSFGFSRNQVAA